MKERVFDGRDDEVFFSKIVDFFFLSIENRKRVRGNKSGKVFGY